MRTKVRSGGINPTDFTFAVIKLFAAFGALLWGIYHPFSPHERAAFLWMIASFFIYNLLIYLNVFRFPDKASRIYLIEFLVDLTFLSIIVPMTGGLNSTFVLGYFLIAAAQSFYYGLIGSFFIGFTTSLVYIFSCPVCLYSMHWTDISLRIAFLLLFSIMLGYLSDREREMHRKLVNTEQLAAIGMMSSQLAHSVRNPLSTISLSAELLLDEVKKLGGDKSEADTLIRSIVNEVYRVNDVVEEHLSFMKRSKTSSGKSNINAVSEALVKFLDKEGERKGISFAKVLDGSLPDIAMEESYLRQALLNVIRNSFDAMPSGGTIKITSRRLKGEAELAIEDTGAGISKENLKRIFDPFFTTKDVGTGLGLYIARDIVLDSGGGISCESRKGKGTTVKIRIPFAVY